jgi:hypothetical protein
MFFFVGRQPGGSGEPLAKSEGRRKRRSGAAVQWRGTPTLDDWAAFIVTGGRSTRSILADHPSERRLNALGRLEDLPKRQIVRFAKSGRLDLAASKPPADA